VTFKIRFVFFIFLVQTLSNFAQSPLSEDVNCSHKRTVYSGRTLKFSPPTEAQLRYDITYYDLFFAINTESREISGKTASEGKWLQSGNLLEFDFASGMIVDSVFFNDKKVTATAISHTSDKLQITLAENAVPGESWQAVIYYHGMPANINSTAFAWSSYAVSGYRVFWTLSEPYGARVWWPCKDTPIDKADSVRIRVEVPADYTVAANGLLIEENQQDNRKTYTWRHSYPIATYLVAIAGAPYTRIDDIYRSGNGWEIPLQYFIYPRNDNATARQQLEAVRHMLDAFNSYFGPYPFRSEKYGIAEMNWSGGMEHQTMTFQINYGRTLTAHELGHQWFGNNVTCANFNHIWLNEGFASYAEALFEEWENGYDSYLDYILGKFYPYSLGTDKSVYVANADSDDPDHVSNIFDRVVYYKGALVVHMLRHVIADDDTFFGLLQNWNSADGFADSAATTEDFSSFCTDYLGYDMSWFFADWIYQSGHPEYVVIWSNKLIGGVDVSIEQVQDGTAYFRMPVDLQFSNSSRDTVVRVWQTERKEEFSISLAFTPDRLTIDPDYKILREIVSVENSNEAILNPHEFSLIGNYPNPFNPETRIVFYTPVPARSTIYIYDSIGRLVRVLPQRQLGAGIHRATWDGRNANGANLGSGVYFYRIAFRADRFGERNEIGRMTLIR
jgi:aminopeptidase N